MIDFRFERAWSQAGYNIWVIERYARNSFIWKPIQVVKEEMPADLGLPEPTLFIPSEEAVVLVPALRNALRGIDWLSKEELETHAKVEKAMQAHIDSLKLVVDRTVKP